MSWTFAPDRRRAIPVRLRVARRRFHAQRFRLPAAAAEPSAVSQHRIQRPHVPHQAQRQRGPRDGARAAPRPRAQPACVRRRAMRAASAGAPSTTTPTPISAPATRICYHGVTDIFRIPKPAGLFLYARNAIRRRRWCWSPASIGRRAINRRAAASGTPTICFQLRSFEDLCEGRVEGGSRSRSRDLSATSASRPLSSI